jgi:hypothetical protein
VTDDQILLITPKPAVRRVFLLQYFGIVPTAPSDIPVYSLPMEQFLLPRMNDGVCLIFIDGDDGVLPEAGEGPRKVGFTDP